MGLNFKNNILIIGGNSFIGQNLINAFENKNYNLHILQRNITTINNENQYYFFNYFNSNDIIEIIKKK